jgi:BASS family bile acid:Na+ symporter
MFALMALQAQQDTEVTGLVSEFEQMMLVILLFVIMFGMGASLTPRDFISAIRRPTGLIIGWLTQFGIMPFVAFLMVITLELPPWIAVGALLMGSVPGGTTSNIFTYFSRGNLALSVLMTTNSTLWAIIMTPFALWLYGAAFGAADVQIPFQNIAATLAILLVPVAIAMVIRRYNANIGAVLELMGGVFGLFVIFFLIVTWVPRNWQLLMTTPWDVYFVAITLGPIGMAIAYFIARFIRLHPANVRTIALETGIQNGPLAIGIVIISFRDIEVMNQAILIPVLYALFIIIISSLVTLYFRRANVAEEQNIPSLL